MKSEKDQPHAAEIMDKINKYEFALKVLVVLEYKFCSLKKMDVRQAKKLRLVSTKPTLHNRVVTPDMVVEAGGRRFRYRAIVEIKESLPTLPENWGGISAQLEKYRLAAGGWEGTEPGAVHDVILAAGAPHAEKIAAWAKEDSDGSGTGEWLIVISIMPTTDDNGDDYIDVAKVHGKLAHPKIDRLLSSDRSCKVSLQKILKEIDQLKFYDSHPPVEYTMTILWDHIFSKFVHAKKRKKISDNKKVLINITMRRVQN